MGICNKPVQAVRRELWRRKNSLEPTRPLLYMRGGNAWDEVPAVTRRQCEDDFYWHYERSLRQQVYRDSLGDDSTFEPWITVGATHRCTGWGLEGRRHRPAEPGGAWKA
ncbi:MAG: hypothetical protein WBF17_12665, partial [Phycisphaerae bacterium]